MTLKSAFQALVLAVALPSLAQPSQPLSRAEHEQARIASLIELASLPGHPPERQAARDALFREIRPQVLAEGTAPTAAESAALEIAASRIACAAGRPRITRALVLGDVAWVAIAGSQGGGCTYLLRRDGGAWVELLPLGWSVQA